MVKKRRGQSAAFMRSINPIFNKPKRRNVFKMARKKRSSRRSSRRYSRSSISSKGDLIGAGIYGLVRTPIANIVTPFVANIGVVPAVFADEAAMGIISYFAAKSGNGYIKSAGKAGLIVEVARLADGLKGSMGTQTSSSSRSAF